MEGGLAVMTGETSCDVLPKLIERLEKENADELDKLGDVEAEGIQVYGETATAYPTADGERGDLVKLRRVGDDWKVDDFSFGGR